MAQVVPGTVSKKAKKDAENLWDSYVVWTKRGIVAITILLCILGVTFI